MSDSHSTPAATRPTCPGRFTKVTVHSPAGELEARLSDAGAWELRIRAAEEETWRFVCDGDMRSGASMAPLVAAAEEPVRLGALVVDRAARTAFVNEDELRLARKEFALLAVLAAQPNRVFTKAELMRAVWGYPEASVTRTLDSHVSRLRRKLHAADLAGVIVNKYGVGYRFWDSPDLYPVPAQLGAS